MAKKCGRKSLYVLDRDGKEHDRPAEVREYIDNWRDIHADLFPDAEQVIPTTEAFCLWIGHGTSTLEDWQRAHPEFKVAMNELRATQYTMLLQGGLSGKYYGPFAQFVLMNLHRWRNKSESDQRHSGELTGISIDLGQSAESSDDGASDDQPKSDV